MSPSVANGVGVGCKRTSASARAALVAALVELPDGAGQLWEKIHCFGDALCACTWNVEAVTSVVVRGGSEVPSIDTVGGPGAAVVRCIVYYKLRAWRC